MSESGWAYAKISLGSSGAVVTGTAGKKIRVLSACIFFDCTTWKPQSHGSSFTDLGGAAAGLSLTLPEAEKGWFETIAGEDLNFNLSGGNTSAQGFLTYELI